VRNIYLLSHAKKLTLQLTNTCSYGKEAGENGRVWKIYKDGAKQLDEASFDAWNDTLDVLLVFVGAF